ncbi:MAG TPA: cupin domain-containing protein, partial [Anaerolineales bacterium]|nr:cupin domain-containing protein [Anaerolineales bacterium]
ERIIEGISIKTLLHGEHMLFSEFHMGKGSKLPMHSHPQEQTGRLLKGKVILTIADEKAELNPGDCWDVPSNVIHGVEVIEESIAIEVFSPVREDYLKYYKK